MSSLLELRLQYRPRLPKLFERMSELTLVSVPTRITADDAVKPYFPKTFGQPLLRIERGKRKESNAFRLGVVLSGGQAPGGHNVIAGLFDGIYALSPQSLLFGFLDGPKGIIIGKYRELKREEIALFRNTGGFDLIGSGRDKIESLEDLQSAAQTVERLKLDGLVIIGGDDSNTNAALLAEYFVVQGIKTAVVGVPKTIDGDLKNEHIELSFGFDTATKVYSEFISNIARDAKSAKKYTHFIKLMGRSASHVALECALQTHPNITLLSEEVRRRKLTLRDIGAYVADIIVKRAASGKNYGVVLIPEGLIEFIPEVNALIKAINTLLAKGVQEIASELQTPERQTFTSLPPLIAQQLLLERDPHGNIQVSHIETEKLIIELVKTHLTQEKFSPICHFLGYEGRSAFPTNFDANYTYALGMCAALIAACGHTGYMATLHDLTLPPEEWKATAAPLTAMMHLEERRGKMKPVIQKALVNLDKESFLHFSSERSTWALQDDYRLCGPIQFFGPPSITEMLPLTLLLHHYNSLPLPVPLPLPD